MASSSWNASSILKLILAMGQMVADDLEKWDCLFEKQVQYRVYYSGVYRLDGVSPLARILP